MRYLIDTNAYSDMMDKHPNVIAHLRGLGDDDELSASAITHGEIYYGLATLPSGRRKASLMGDANAVFASLREVVPITWEVAEVYADLKAKLEAKGKRFSADGDDNDVWIAAVALHGGFTLVTADKHFKEVKGLRVVNWREPPKTGRERR
jgi:hypothetical protein